MHGPDGRIAFAPPAPWLRLLVTAPGLAPSAWPIEHHIARLGSDPGADVRLPPPAPAFIAMVEDDLLGKCAVLRCFDVSRMTVNGGQADVVTLRTGDVLDVGTIKVVVERVDTAS